MNCRAAAMVLLGGLGIARMTCDLVGWKPAAALLGVTGCAPAPKVFTTVAGHEGFTATFALVGDGQEFPLTRQRRLQGPYARRNTYGAVLAYAPAFLARPETTPMLHAMLTWSLAHDRLPHELGVPPAKTWSIRLRDRDGRVTELP